MKIATNLKGNQFIKAYVSTVTALTDDDRIDFYNILAAEMCEAVGQVCTDKKISDAVKVKSVKWMNEIIKYMIYKIAFMRQDQAENYKKPQKEKDTKQKEIDNRDDEESYGEIIDTCICQYPAIRLSVISTINKSLATKRLHANNRKHK